MKRLNLEIPNTPATAEPATSYPLVATAIHEGIFHARYAGPNGIAFDVEEKDQPYHQLLQDALRQHPWPVEVEEIFRDYGATVVAIQPGGNVCITGADNTPILIGKDVLVGGLQATLELRNLDYGKRKRQEREQAERVDHPGFGPESIQSRNGPSETTSQAIKAWEAARDEKRRQASELVWIPVSDSVGR